MKTKKAFAAAAWFIAVGGAVGQSGGAAYAQDTPANIGALTRGVFQKPNSAKPAGSTVFTPASDANLFVERLLKNPKLNTAQKQAMQQYAGQINDMVETAYTNYGYKKNDLGVALGGLLETTWQINDGSFRVGGDDTPEEKQKTQAVIRQVQNALLSNPLYQTMSGETKQLVYEACTFSVGNFATQWAQAGDAAKKAALKKEAAEQMQSFFGVSPGKLTRRPDGTFVSTSGAASSGTTAATATAKSKAAKKAASGPLPAASSHGAQIFVKYTFQVTKTSLDQLILFPSGAAFLDLPPNSVPSFDEATLRAKVKPFYVGTWKKTGSTITLNMPNATSDKMVVLHKVAKGWYDGKEVDNGSSYNTYFPVRLLTPQTFAGPWKSQSLTTMGTLGGSAPMVAAGSTGNYVFNADGTFSGDKKSFASATTQNPDTANVGVYNTNNKNGQGRWRLDGPVLTRESGGKRTVTLAFILPNWNKTGPAEILVDGERWERPEKK